MDQAHLIGSCRVKESPGAESKKAHGALRSGMLSVKVNLGCAECSSQLWLKSEVIQGK